MGQAVPDRQASAPADRDRREAAQSDRTPPAPDAEAKRFLHLLRGVLDRLPE